MHGGHLAYIGTYQNPGMNVAYLALCGHQPIEHTTTPDHIMARTYIFNTNMRTLHHSPSLAVKSVHIYIYGSFSQTLIEQVRRQSL